MVHGRYETDRTAVDDGPPGPPSTVDSTRPPESPLADPAAVHFDDEERPARALTGPVGLGVAVVAFAAALLVLWQVFRPLAQGSQFYLIIFLAATLPLVFLVYRSGISLGRKSVPAEERFGPAREMLGSAGQDFRESPGQGTLGQGGEGVGPGGERTALSDEGLGPAGQGQRSGQRQESGQWQNPGQSQEPTEGRDQGAGL